MPHVRVRDLDLYYERYGSGPPVLQISGTGGDLRQNPARGKGLLERRFDVVMYDQRGLGQTSKPPGPYAMADYADDAVALLDELGWDRCHVFGLSFGGMVAQQVAVRHPDRVDRLVLACTSAGGPGGSSFDLIELEGLSPEDRMRRWLPLLDTRADVSTDPPTMPPGLEGIERAIRRGLEGPAPDADSARGARLQLEARAGHDVWDQLRQIAAPTLVIGGRYDGQAPPANSERLAERIPDARLVLCDGGHAFLLQDPTALPTIVDFLAAT